MKNALRTLAAMILSAFLIVVATSVVQAQAQPLPTAPGAQKAVSDGPRPQAPASVPGYGGSPLEPWLIVWLLPISGILAVGVATATDRAIRAGRI